MALSDQMFPMSLLTCSLFFCESECADLDTDHHCRHCLIAWPGDLVLNSVRCGEKIPGVEGERDTLITWNHEEIEQLCFSIVFNGFMFLLFRAKSVTILFPKVKGTIYHIVFVTFLSRVLSGITTTHRQPSLIIETGKHQNQPRYSLLCSEL